MAREPNDHLRRARERVESPYATGQPLSRGELADLVNAWVYEHTHAKRVVALDANYFGKLERGGIRWPQADYRAALRAVLGVGTDAELGFRRPRRVAPTVASVDRKEFLRTAFGATAGVMALPMTELLTSHQPTAVPSVVGAEEIDRIRITAGMFANWDASYGGGLVREAVAAQLRYCAQLLEARCAERRRGELFGAVGDLADVAAFMAFDACAHDDARRLFDFALGCAEESGDWHLRAKVLSNMARQAIRCGDPDGGLTLVEFGMVRADRLTATERACLLIGRARALAKLGHVQDTMAAVRMADEEYTNARPAEDVPWMSYYDAAQHAGDTGHALFDLALHGRFVTEAISRLQTAVDGHTDAYVRSRLFSQTKLAALTLAVGDPDHGAEIGTQAVRDAAQVRSTRATEDLRELRHLAEQHRQRPDVAALCRGIGNLVAAS